MQETRWWEWLFLIGPRSTAQHVIQSEVKLNYPMILEVKQKKCIKRISTHEELLC